jgi:hypothetical protein
MNKFTNPLSNIKIASPCSQDWNGMIGTDRKRFCGECKLNVYNLSGMSEQDAENLLMNSEGRLCVRFYRRADGSVLTKDCPVGWQAIKRRVSRVSTAAASLIFGLVSGLGINNYFSSKEEVNIMGAVGGVNNYENRPIDIIPISEEVEIKGKPVADYAAAGGISNIDEIRGQVQKKRRR